MWWAFSKTGELEWLTHHGCMSTVPVRTASEQPYRLQDFELRMFYASDIAQPSPEVRNLDLISFVIAKCKVLRIHGHSRGFAF